MATEFNSSALKTTYAATLKAYYRFESGALTTDTSGNTHTLTAISDPAEDASGKFGGAVAYDSDDAHSAADHADFKPTGAYTISFWIKRAAGINAYGCAFQSYSAPASVFKGITVYVTDTNTIRLGQYTDGSTYHEMAGSDNVSNGAWHMVTCTWDTTTMKLYVDGVLDESDAYSTAPAYAATNYVRSGCLNVAGTNADFLNGNLDDLFVLNGTALTLEEIQSLYETSSSGAGFLFHFM